MRDNFIHAKSLYDRLKDLEDIAKIRLKKLDREKDKELYKETEIEIRKLAQIRLEVMDFPVFKI